MRRQPQITHASKPTRFQSTHPSGVRRITNDVFDRVRTISIHAPQWGATERRDGVFGGGEISIHAPQWGATLTPPESRSYSAIFQSTHPSGVRRATGSAQTWTRPISIHAPQWGATTRGKPNNPRDNYFNPRTPVGCDSFSFAPHAQSSYFNPRTPVGCDDGKNAHHHCQGFQSTHPSGVRRRTTSINTVRR